MMKVSDLTKGLEKLQEWKVVKTGEHNLLILQKGCVQLERNGNNGWWATVYTDLNAIQRVFSTSILNIPPATSAAEALTILRNVIDDAAAEVSRVRSEV